MCTYGIKSTIPSMEQFKMHNTMTNNLWHTILWTIYDNTMAGTNYNTQYYDEQFTIHITMAKHFITYNTLGTIHYLQ